MIERVSFLGRGRVWRREKWYGSTADVCHCLVQPPADVISLGYQYLERGNTVLLVNLFTADSDLCWMQRCPGIVIGCERSDRSVVVNFVLAVRVGT